MVNLVPVAATGSAPPVCGFEDLAADPSPPMTVQGAVMKAHDRTLDHLGLVAAHQETPRTGLLPQIREERYQFGQQRNERQSRNREASSRRNDQFNEVDDGLDRVGR